MSQERKNEITFLNVLFCLLVVLIHVLSYTIATFSPGTAEYDVTRYTAVMLPQRLISFVVQGFIMLSGVKMFLTGKDKVPYFKYLSGRFKSIVIPYVICFFVYYIYLYVVYGEGYGYTWDFPVVWDFFYLGKIASHLYFIPLLLQFDLLMPLWKYIVNKFSPVIVIPVAVFLGAMFENFFPAAMSIAFPDKAFLYNDRIVMTYIGFWIVGCYIGKYYDSFKELLRRNFSLIVSVFLLTSAACAYYSYLAFNWLANVPFMNQLHYFYAFCAVIFLYALGFKIPQSIFEKVRLISMTDRASYYIYLWHMLVLLITESTISHLEITSPLPALLVRAIVVYTVSLTPCILYSEIKRFVMKKLITRKQQKLKTVE